MESKAANLVVRMIVKFAGAVGYGEVFEGTILRVVTGQLADERVSIVILAGDTVNGMFLSSRLDSHEIEMGCHRKDINVVYPMMPISGFVDRSGTCWEIDYLKDPVT